MPEVLVPLKEGKPVVLDDLGDVVAELLRESKGIKVWLFEGDLGAGKTTLIKAIGHALGVKENMSSPSFSIINEYTAAGSRLYHFDFYRLEKEQEAFDIGTDEYFESGNFCFVEWAEKIPSLIPAAHINIKITPGTSPDNRIIAYARYE